MVHFSVLPNTLASDLRTGDTKNADEDQAIQAKIGAQKPTNVWPYLLVFLFILIGIESRLAFQVSPSRGN